MHIVIRKFMEQDNEEYVSGDRTSEAEEAELL